MNNPEILLISGWGHSAAPMQMVANRLGLGGCRALSLRDLYEAVPAAAPGLSVYATALKHILEQCPDKVHVVGWSTGGVAAIETARVCAGRLRSLVLLSSTPVFCAQEDFPFGTPPAALRAMVTALRHDPAATLASFITQAAAPLPLQEEQVNDTIQTALAQGTTVLEHGLQYLRTSDFRSAVPHISCPCLIIHGRKDTIVPWCAADWLHKQLPQSELQLYLNGGHALLAQNGNEIVEKLRTFLERSR